MPPKKKVQQKMSESIRLRREFQRKRAPAPRTIQASCTYDEDVEVPESFLYHSRYIEPVTKTKTNLKTVKKKVFVSPNVSDDEVRVSSDEEDAGQFNEPEHTDADAAELEAIKKDYDSLDDVSLVLLTYDNVRMKTDENGVICGVHEKQLDEKWKPAIIDEVPGNYPQMNKPHKKVEHKTRKKKQQVPTAQAAKPNGDFRQSIRVGLERDARQTTFRNEAIMRSGRVFGTPARMNLSVRSVFHGKNDRLSIFSYTPIRGNQMSSLGNAARFSTSSPFSPKIQNASTPIEKQGKGRTAERMPVFNFSDVLENSERDLERQTTGIAQKQIDVAFNQTAQTNEAEVATVRNSTLKDATAKEKTITGDGSRVDDPEEQEQPPESGKSKTKSFRREEESNKSTQPTTETIGAASETETTVQLGLEAEASSFRKADISMTEMLQESSEMPNDDTYSKKRQRTKSPETMCQGTSTMMAMSMQENEEKENGGRRRGTLQPQTQQLLRESRLSTMTTASSRRASIDSLLEEMTIALPDDDDDELALMKTGLSEGVSRMESRNQGTAMTIRNDEPEREPYYFADMSFGLERNGMNALLHNAEQTEPRAWTTLPKGSMDGRTLKKLGEGSYGEVYSTKWDGALVAIKVVPFEESEDTRKYTGDYNGGAMPTADTILPELLIMKELSALNNLNLTDATPNFINLISAKVLKGPYPKGLLKAWNTFDEQGEGSMNTRPDEYATKDQLFMLFVTSNGGVALETFQLKDEDELHSIIVQLALSLEAAENALNFEHRDLHLGNVLIDRNGVENLSYKIRGHDITVKTKGVKVNIIDFTLSHIYKDGCAVFMDLEQDPGLFEGKGDPQFDVYRKMRDHCRNEWGQHHRKSNVMWLQFLANQLVDNPDICPANMTEDRKSELRKLFKRLGEFETCGESFTEESFYNLMYKDYMV